ncbi:MAG: hypothetical protein ACOCVV_11705 [Marinobacter sp.]
MFRKDPVLVHDIFNRTYELTRRPRHSGSHDAEAFIHDRAYATETLRRIASHTGHDPFNHALHEAWQLVHDKPWTSPPNMTALIRDLADAIHQGRLYAYTQGSSLRQPVR